MGKIADIIERINIWLGDNLNIGEYATHFEPYPNDVIQKNINNLKDPYRKGYEQAVFDMQYKNNRRKK